MHSIIHAFGILFGIISIPILTALAAKNANVNGIIGAGIYGFTFIMTFTFSTLYHAFQQKQVKRTLEIFDHISLYFYGIGFGYFGQLERYEIYVVVAVVWTIQIIWSHLWLRYFLFGPIEWVWRSLTYWKKQPMRRMEV